MHRLSVSIAAIAVSATAAAAQNASPYPNIACAAPFAREATHASLTAAFGAPNVTYTDVPGPEGSTEKATVIHGPDPKRRLEISWADEEKRARILMIHIADKSTWIAPLGVRIGSTLAEIEKLNGKPFKISGFDWDMGGHATFPPASPLSKVAGGCTVSVRFTYTVPNTKGASKITGDRQVSSSLPEMRAAKPKVTDVYIGYAAD